MSRATVTCRHASGVAVRLSDAQAAAQALQSALAAADLPGLGPGQRAELTADAEVSEPAPPPTSIRARITGVLREAGALAGAAGAFVGPVTALAQWLGPLGASVLAMPACRSTSQPCSWTRGDPASAPRRRPRGP
jgi:hypothetical protein